MPYCHSFQKNLPARERKPYGAPSFSHRRPALQNFSFNPKLWGFKIAHDLPGDHRHSDFALQQLSRITLADIERINIHHSDVGPAPRGNYATLFLPKGSISRPGRVSSYSLFRRHPRFGLQAVGRLQALVATRDGRVQAVE